jgi:polyhydroxyalkanoate synthase subunit PhaC
MTADVGRTSLDGRADGRGDVPHDETDAVESVENGEAVAMPSIGGFLRGLGLALAQTGPVTREARRLARESARIVRGTDQHLPSPRDKRFSDQAWSKNPVYRRVGQLYLAAGGAASRLVDDLEAQQIDWHDVDAPGSRSTR